MTDVAVTVKLYVMSGGEHRAARSGCASTRSPTMKNVAAAWQRWSWSQHLRRPGWVGAVVEGEAQSVAARCGALAAGVSQAGGSRAASRLVLVLAQEPLEQAAVAFLVVEDRDHHVVGDRV